MSPDRGANTMTVQGDLHPWFLDWKVDLRNWDVRWSFSDDVESELAARPTGATVLPELNEKQVYRSGLVGSCT